MSMRFRTELAPYKAPFGIGHDEPVLLLGSCFSDSVGERLGHDGFDVLANPFGALYNPLSIENCLRRAVEERAYTAYDLRPGPRGFHCLDYATRFSGADAEAVLADVEGVRASVAEVLKRKPVVIVTLGTAYVFYEKETGMAVGNCHKFPAEYFERRRLPVPSAAASVERMLEILNAAGCRKVVFTVSPIRHLADGLHGNQLSKATLHLAIDSALADGVPVGMAADYFPAYEALVDDLRDYRFYAADMKHPSEVAVDYIYGLFSDAYFDAATRAAAVAARAAARRSAHRPILD